MAISDTNSMNAGTFGVTRGNEDVTSPSALPVPGAMPIAQQETPIVKNNISVQGGSSGGGGIFGALGKVVGAALPLLLSDGGFVKGYADGGLNTQDGNYGPQGMLEPPAGPQQDSQQNTSQMHSAAAAMGYLVGAYHQQKYGGTPDTLVKATNEFKQLVTGGNQQADPDAQKALSDAVGMPSQPAPKDMLEPGPAARPAQPQPAPQMPPQPMPAPQPQPGAKPAPIAMPQQQPPQASMTGYMQPIHFAEGGPPPLAPGQPFEGSGEVNGPGTSTSDSIPAKLSDGEYVMSAAATQFFGVDKLNSMNEKGKQGYMQAIHGVEQNQGQKPGMPPSAPGAMPSAPPAMPVGGAMKPPIMPPMMSPGQQKPMSHGGPAMRPKSSGYMGC